MNSTYKLSIRMAGNLFTLSYLYIGRYVQPVHNGLKSNGNSTCTRSQSLLNILHTSLAWGMILINGKHNIHDTYCE